MTERWMFHGPDHNIHVCEERDPNMRVCFMTSTGPTVKRARLIAAAPELLEAIISTRKLVSEAAMTGFNCHDGDWAERLFANQAGLSAALAKATESRP